MSQTAKPNRLIPTLILLFVLLPAIASGGLYLGAMIFTRWLNLKTAASVGLLPRYWSVDKLPEPMQTPLLVSSVVAALITLAPVLMLLIAMLIKPKRELHGSSRFANAMEIRQSGLLFPKNPPPAKKGDRKAAMPDLLIGKYGDEYLRWAGNEFLYLAAPTRSGKGVGIVIPNCLHYRDSMVVYDPKLENYLITAGFRAKHGQQVFLFNPGGRTPEHERNPNAPLVSHRWNPFTYIRRNPHYTYKDLSNMAAILFPKPAKDSGGSAGIFFIESARKLFVGLSLYMIETEAERDLSDYTQRTTLANLFRLTSPTTGEPLNEWLKTELETREQQGKALSNQCQTLLYGFVNGNAKTGGDILSTLTAPLGIFLDPVVEAATSDDDFRLDELRQKRMTIYIGIVPTETDTFSRLTNLFFSQLIDVNVQQGLPENNPKLKYQCLLLMDEFTALGVIPAVQHGVSYIAGYALRLLIIIQAPSQVEAIYGRENMKTFFTNFTCRIFYTPREQDDAEEYSKVIGYETFKAKSTSSQSGGGKRSTSTSDQKRAVLNPDEIKLMPSTDCVINLNGLHAIYAKKIIYWQDPIFAERANLPLPSIPALEIKTHSVKAAPLTTAAEQPIPENELAETHVDDCANAPECQSVILQMLRSASDDADYLADIHQTATQVWKQHGKELAARWAEENSATA